jgi:ribosomal protein S15
MNGSVTPVTGMSLVATIKLRKVCPASSDTTPIASSFPNGSRVAAAISTPAAMLANHFGCRYDCWTLLAGSKMRRRAAFVRGGRGVNDRYVGPLALRRVNATIAVPQVVRQIKLDEFRKHAHDTSSLEYQIALASKEILRLEEHLSGKGNRDVPAKVRLLKMTGRREKLLRTLRNQDLGAAKQTAMKLGLYP